MWQEQWLQLSICEFFLWFSGKVFGRDWKKMFWKRNQKTSCFYFLIKYAFDLPVENIARKNRFFHKNHHFYTKPRNFWEVNKLRLNTVVRGNWKIGEISRASILFIRMVYWVFYWVPWDDLIWARTTSFER